MPTFANVLKQYKSIMSLYINIYFEKESVTKESYDDWSFINRKWNCNGGNIF